MQRSSCAREDQMSPEAQLERFIAKFTPEIVALAQAALTEMRNRLPNAIQLVYDNYNALVIGFGPTERASDAIFSIALYPKSVNLCFLQAGKVGLNDPRKILQGSGTTNRFITLRSATALNSPEIQDLVAQALTAAKVPMKQSASGRLVIKSVAAKQRPRRPGRA